MELIGLLYPSSGLPSLDYSLGLPNPDYYLGYPIRIIENGLLRCWIIADYRTNDNWIIVKLVGLSWVITLHG